MFCCNVRFPLIGDFDSDSLDKSKRDKTNLSICCAFFDHCDILAPVFVFGNDSPGNLANDRFAQSAEIFHLALRTNNSIELETARREIYESEL